MKRFLALLFLLFSAFAYANENAVVVAIEEQTPRINPLYDEDHDPTLSLVFSGLTSHDENSHVVPELAKSWQVSDDGLEYIFELRDDAFWHDGVKFSAKDVKFTIEAAQDKKLNAPAISNYEVVKSVEILGDYKVKITLKEPFPPFLDALSFGVLPEHILKGKDIATDKFNDAPIGTGAYKLVKWKKDESLEFVANDKFYKGEPKIKRLFLKIVGDENLRLIGLKSGEIDVALISPTGVNFIKDDKKLSLLKFKSADYRALMFNFNDPIFQDKNVRIALNYAVNKDEIVKKLFHGYASVANNPIEKSFANDSEFKFSYDPQKARELLEKSGFKKNKAGFFEKDGKELGFDIYAFNNDILRVNLAKILSSEFEKFGVRAKAYAKPRTAFSISKVDSFVIGWGSPFDPDFHTYRIFGGFADVSVNENGWNFSHYKDANVDLSLKNARYTKDVELRKKYYKEFLKALHENPPYIFIAYLDYPLVFNNKISGIKTQILGHHGAGFLWNIREWQVK